MRHPGYISDKQYFWSLKSHKIIKKYNGDTYDEFGFGIDRFVMMITNNESIREVIAFPHIKPEN